MVNKETVQNGTYKRLGKDVGIVAAVNSDSNFKVSVYLSEREKYVSEFNLWSKKTAQAILETGRVVYEAKQNLSKDEFKAFVGDIKAGPTIRKYLAIGKRYDKFYQYAVLLPNAWTSIYEITLLPADVFDALVATESSMANMTGAQLKLLKRKGSDSKSKSSDASATTASTDSTAVNANEVAQNSSETSEIADESQSQSDMSEAATASSDVIQNDSSESDADAAESNDTANDDTSHAFDHEFAKQATSTMLERVAATASKTVEVKAEDDFEPYEITIRFNKMPSDEAKFELAEYVYKVKNKYRLDIEVVSNYVEV